jgi:hypothetical protein
MSRGPLSRARRVGRSGIGLCRRSMTSRTTVELSLRITVLKDILVGASHGGRDYYYKFILSLSEAYRLNLGSPRHR